MSLIIINYAMRVLHGNVYFNAFKFCPGSRNFYRCDSLTSSEILSCKYVKLMFAFANAGPASQTSASHKANIRATYTLYVNREIHIH